MIDRLIDKIIDWLIDWLIDRLIYRLIYRLLNILIYRLTWFDLILHFYIPPVSSNYIYEVKIMYSIYILWVLYKKVCKNCTFM